MRIEMKRGLVALVSAPILGLMAASAAMAEPEICNRNTARIAANGGDMDTLCGCSHVTPGFLTQLQRHADFGNVLQATSAQCPGLAGLLTDLPTGSITTASTEDGRSNDPGLVWSGGNSGPNPNTGGGGDDPGDGDDPGNGPGKPGHGGGKPGHGGGKPGHGGGKPGDGGGKPGDGGGKPGHGGGDKPGKGGGKPGHGGGDKPGKGGGGKGKR